VILRSGPRQLKLEIPPNGFFAHVLVHSFNMAASFITTRSR
jgi:hypothetical protein